MIESGGLRFNELKKNIRISQKRFKFITTTKFSNEQVIKRFLSSHKESKGGILFLCYYYFNENIERTKHCK